LSVSNSYKGYLQLFTFIYTFGLAYTLANCYINSATKTAPIWQLV